MKSIKIATLSLLFVAAFPSIAQAEKWEDVGTAPNGTLIRVDVDSIENSGATSRRFKEALVFPTPDPQSGIKSTIANSEVLCNDRRIARKQVVGYSDRGQPLVSNVNPRFVIVDPGTINEAIFNYVCNYRR